MKELVNQILNHKELAALPSLLEGGGLPALVSGLSAVTRANLAAALCGTMDRPLFVICPDDTAAENFARDLRSMLQRPADCLGLREYCFSRRKPSHAGRSRSGWRSSPPCWRAGKKEEAP